MFVNGPELEKRAANFVPLRPVSFLARAASFFGDRTAVVHGSRRFTYTEFYARARRLAHALTKAGISAATRSRSWRRTCRRCWRRTTRHR